MKHQATSQLLILFTLWLCILPSQQTNHQRLQIISKKSSENPQKTFHSDVYKHLPYSEIINIASAKTLRHIFKKNEKKTIAIGDHWNLKFSGLAFKNGKKMGIAQVNKEIKFKTNLDFTTFSTNHSGSKYTYARQINNLVALTHLNDFLMKDLVISQSKYNVNSAETMEVQKNSMKFQKTRCFKQVPYEKELFLLCVETNPSFNFQHTINTEFLVLIRCSLYRFYCKKYSFSYGAHALFFWVFQRYFWKAESTCRLNELLKFDSKISAKLDSQVVSSEGPTDKENINWSIVNESQKSENSEDNIIVDFADGITQNNIWNRKEHAEYFSVDSYNITQRFDYCFLSRIIFTRITGKTFGLGFSPKLTNEIFTLKLDLVHSRGSVELEQGKEIFIQNLAILDVHRIGPQLLVCELAESFIVVDETQLIDGDVYSDSPNLEGKRYFENRKFKNFFYDSNQSKIFIYATENENNLEQIEFRKGNGVWKFWRSLKVWQNEVNSSLIVFAIKRKSLFIYGLKSQLKINRRIQICVDHFQEWPFQQSCGVSHFLYLSSNETQNTLNFSVFKFKDSIMLFLDKKFVTISFSFPLYEVIINPSFEKKEQEIYEYSKKSEKIALMTEQNMPLVKYELIMNEAGTNEIHLFLIQIIPNHNVIWNRHTSKLNSNNRINITQYQTIIQRIKGNFLYSDDDLFKLQFYKESSLDFGSITNFKTQKRDFLHNLKSQIIDFFGANSKPENIEWHAIEVDTRDSDYKSSQSLLFLIKLRHCKHYFVIEADPGLNEHRIKYFQIEKMSFVGLIKKKYIVLYNGQNFYIKLASFNRIQDNLGILKARCLFYFFYKTIFDVTILFCVDEKEMNAYINKGDLVNFEGPFKIDLKVDLRRFKGYNIRIYQMYWNSRRMVMEMSNPDTKRCLILLFRVELIDSDSKSNEETEKIENFSKLKIKLSKIHEWDIKEEVAKVISETNFTIGDFIITQKRFFVIITLQNEHIFGLNFQVSASNNLDLIYAVDFQTLLPKHSGLKSVKILKKIEFDYEMYQNTMVLLRALYGQELVILHFLPSYSFLTAFPFMTFASFFETEMINIPWKAELKESIKEFDKLNINSRYFFLTYDQESGEVSIKSRKVFLYPHLTLQYNEFQQTKLIDIYSWTDAKPLMLRVDRTDSSQSANLDFISSTLQETTLNLDMRSSFPVDVEIDPLMVIGNVFDIHLQCEKENESHMNQVEKMQMLKTQTLFQSQDGSMTRHAHLNINKSEGLVYLYNRNIFWVLSMEGTLLNVFYLNKYLVTPPHLMYEFRGKVTSERLFLYEKFGILVKAITNRITTCLFFYQINTAINKVETGNTKEENIFDNLEGVDLLDASLDKKIEKSISIKLIKVNILSVKIDLNQVYLKKGLFIEENSQESMMEIIITHWDNLMHGSFNHSLSLKIKKNNLYAIESVTFIFDNTNDFFQEKESEIIINKSKAESERKKDPKPEKSIELKTFPQKSKISDKVYFELKSFKKQKSEEDTEVINLSNDNESGSILSMRTNNTEVEFLSSSDSINQDSVDFHDMTIKIERDKEDESENSQIDTKRY